ncbi:MAG: VgrG-related protein [Chloroflexota bacterium]
MIAPKKFSSPFVVKLNGSALPEADQRRIISLRLDQDLNIPDMFTIVLHDVKHEPGQKRSTVFGILDDDTFAIGAKIDIQAGRGAPPQDLFRGEITSVEMEARGDGDALATARGYDGSHRLHRERKSRSFLNQSDSDIARKIAQEANLQPNVESTSHVYDYVFQDNQTNWEFLVGRANRIGFEVFVVDRTLHFRRPPQAQQPIELELGDNLLSVQVRMGVPGQTKEVIVKGWDPKTKKEIVGLAKSSQAAPKIGERRSADQLGQRFGPSSLVLTNQPVYTQAEADSLAQAVLDEITAGFVQLEGVCLGNPKLKPGARVQLKGMGQRFAGEYYVSSTTHLITMEGYTTSFVVSGRRPNSLLGLLNSGNGKDGNSLGGGGKHAGVAIGVVTNNQDPENLGRVKVKFPWLADDESHWARLASPMAGNSRGLFFMPEVGDEVLVAFDHGDIHHPYVIGSVWNGNDAPPISSDDAVGGTGKVKQRIIKTRTGHKIVIDDDDAGAGGGITIVDKDEKNKIHLDAAGKGKLTLDVKGDLEISVIGDITIRGQNVQITGTTKVKVQAPVIELN